MPVAIPNTVNSASVFAPSAACGVSFTPILICVGSASEAGRNIGGRSIRLLPPVRRRNERRPRRLPSEEVCGNLMCLYNADINRLHTGQLFIFQRDPTMDDHRSDDEDFRNVVAFAHIEQE